MRRILLHADWLSQVTLTRSRSTNRYELCDISTVFMNNRRVLAGGLSLCIGTSALYYHQNEGVQRSLYFWRHALPIFVRYRYVQKWITDPEEQSRQYHILHERYAASVFDDIILPLKGFYVKLAQVASTRADFLTPRLFKSSYCITG